MHLLKQGQRLVVLTLPNQGRRQLRIQRRLIGGARQGASKNSLGIAILLLIEQDLSQPGRGLGGKAAPVLRQTASKRRYASSAVPASPAASAIWAVNSRSSGVSGLTFNAESRASRAAAGSAVRSSAANPRKASAWASGVGAEEVSAAARCNCSRASSCFPSRTKSRPRASRDSNCRGFAAIAWRYLAAADCHARRLPPYSPDRRAPGHRPDVCSDTALPAAGLRQSPSVRSCLRLRPARVRWPPPGHGQSRFARSEAVFAGFSSGNKAAWPAEKDAQRTQASQTLESIVMESFPEVLPPLRRPADG